jgi:hypothetical protein
MLRWFVPVVIYVLKPSEFVLAKWFHEYFVSQVMFEMHVFGDTFTGY